MRCTQDDEACRKRYTDLAFAPIHSFASASLERDATVDCPGVVVPVDEGALAGLDFREQGYHRVDITADIEPYPGFAVVGTVYAYVDDSPDVGAARVSTKYAKMALVGARGWDTVVPGFFDDYCAAGLPPEKGMEPMRFFWIGEDGCSVWMLDEESCGNVLLMTLPCPLFPPRLNITPFIKNKACPEQGAYVDGHQGQRNIPAEIQIIHTLLQKGGEAEYCHHACWLVRLACLCGAASAQMAQALLNDDDVWVRRAARSISSAC